MNDEVEPIVAECSKGRQAAGYRNDAGRQGGCDRAGVEHAPATLTP